jgi:hypothetical protein
MKYMPRVKVNIAVRPKTQNPALLIAASGLIEAVNECGQHAAVQSFPDPDTLQVWNLTAKFSDQQKLLTFSNGTVWQRQ